MPLRSLARLLAFLPVFLPVLALSACGGREGGDPPQAGASASSPLALTPDGRTLWVVNPDADTVTPVDVRTLVAGVPVAVGAEPWAVAVAPGGTVLVLNRAAGSLSFLAAGGRTDLPLGPEPGGLALSPDGRLAYVTLSSAGQVAVVDVGAKAVLERVAVGPQPWAIAVVGDMVLVGHRFARLLPGAGEGENDGKEAWLTVLRGGARSEVGLPPHPFGYPNVLEAVAVAGATLYLSHLLNAPEPPNDFLTVVSGGLSAVSLTDLAERQEARLELNDPAFSTPTNFPRALAASPDGTTLYLVLAGTDAIMGIDLSEPAEPRLLGFWPTGGNPRGIVVDAGGDRAYVMNYLSRDVSVLDLRDLGNRPELARVSVTDETLAPEVLRGKVLFNAAIDPRMSRNGWLSCASCHVDGGADGTTWLLGEGPRQTIPLWGLAGTAPFHAAATRDELQDSELDIELLMKGVGLAPGAANRLLGEPNGGRSADLDALAAFLLTSIRVPAAPPVDPQAAARGRALFEQRGCQTCHRGPAWTTSHLPGPVGSLARNGEQVVAGVLHDVGTYDPMADLTGEQGFDVPSLLGLHASAPYFHAGDATTLAELLEHAAHSGPALTPADAADLVAFLHSIDASTEGFD